MASDFLDADSSNRAPQDTDALHLGAGVIRTLKNNLITVLTKLFNAADGSWITGDNTNGLPGTALKNATVDSTKLTTVGLSTTTYFDNIKVDAAGRVVAGTNVPTEYVSGPVTSGTNNQIDGSLYSTFYLPIIAVNTSAATIQPINFGTAQEGKPIMLFLQWTPEPTQFTMTVIDYLGNPVQWLGAAPTLTSPLSSGAAGTIATRFDLVTLFWVNGALYGTCASRITYH